MARRSSHQELVEKYLNAKLKNIHVETFCLPGKLLFKYSTGFTLCVLKMDPDSGPFEHIEVLKRPQDQHYEMCLLDRNDNPVMHKNGEMSIKRVNAKQVKLTIFRVFKVTTIARLSHKPVKSWS